MGRNFEEWFYSQEWWHEGTARGGMDEAREIAHANGIDDATLVAIAEPIIAMMRNEYGE